MFPHNLEIVAASQELPGQLIRIGDGGGEQNELGLAPVEPADALESAQHLAHLASEDPPIGVHFIDDHESQGLPERYPFMVKGEEGIVEHIGVGEKDVRRMLANLGPLIRWGVPVIDGGDERKGGIFLEASSRKVRRSLQLVSE